MSTADADPLPLAPAAVLRAALWPVDAVSALADAGAGAPDHDTRLLHELAALWQRTLGEPRFRRALAVSNPALYARLQRTVLPKVWNKRTRQLAATLYQYLARACWRTEPNGLWAGIRLVAWNAPSPPLGDYWCVTPNLAPLRALFELRVADESYAARGRCRLHCGLVRLGTGDWCIRTARGVRRIRVRTADATGRAAADAALRALHGLAPAPRAEFVRRAATVLHDVEQANVFVDALLRARVLLGGLRFPAHYETAWQAIDRAARRLQPADRKPWNECAARLRSLCSALESSADRLHADQVLGAMASATEALRDLAAQWSLLLPTLPRAVLQFDTAVPWFVHLDDSVQARARAALRSAEAYRQHADPVAAYDRSHARGLLAGAALDDAKLAFDLAQRRAMSRQWRSGPAQPGLHDESAPPFGVLLLRFGAQECLVNGFSHEPWLVYGRFGALFDPARAHAKAACATVHRHALHRWCESTVRTVARAADLKPALLIAPSGDLPNLWAQPRFAGVRRFELRGTEAHRPPALGALVCSDGSREWIEIGGPGRPMRLIALCASALDVGAQDAEIERLLLTSWRYRPPVRLDRGSDVPCGQALAIAPGTNWQRARWDLGAACTAALLAMQPAERWTRWQQLAALHRWPPLLTLWQSDGPPVLLPRDSALAVETLVRGLRAGQRLIVEAAGDECFAQDPKGNRYATELAVVFGRRTHAWSSRSSRPPDVDADLHQARRPRPPAALAQSGAGRLDP